jgi:hypothetical protein
MTPVCVVISFPLFGKPAWELGGENGPVTPQELSELGDDLRDRLHEAAEVVRKVTAAGGDVSVTLYDLALSLPAPDIDSEAQARQRLRTLGIDPEAVILHDGGEADSWPGPAAPTSCGSGLTRPCLPASTVAWTPAPPSFS